MCIRDRKQRVAIARALVLQPKILLCDEPTSALDPQTTDNILQFLRSINQELGVTLIIVTHEMEVIHTLCHRVAVMEKGSIQEELSLNQSNSPKTSIGHMLMEHRQKELTYPTSSLYAGGIVHV